MYADRRDPETRQRALLEIPAAGREVILAYYKLTAHESRKNQQSGALAVHALMCQGAKISCPDHC